MSIVETLGAEAWRVIQPGVTPIVSSALAALAELIRSRIPGLPRDSARAIRKITAAAEKDPEFRRQLAEHLAALRAAHPGDEPRPGPLGFVDRDLVRAQLLEPGTHLVVGLPGVGKTYLVDQVLHDAHGRYPDGQYRIDLRKYRTTAGTLRYADVQRDVLTFLGVTGIETSEVRLDEQYLTALCYQRFVVGFDGVADEQEMRHLGRGWPAASVIFTSRIGLSALVGRPIRLGGLDEPGVRQLMAEAGLSAALEAEPRAALELLELCGGFPLTLQLAARLLGSRGAQPGAVGKTLAELRNNPDPDGFDAAMIGHTVRRLPPVISADLALLARHPGGVFTFDTATAWLGRPAGPTLRYLQTACLLTEEAAGWWRLPGPVSAYVTRLDVPETVAEAAIGRMLDRYPALAVAADVAKEADRLRRYPKPGNLDWDEPQDPVDWLDAMLPMLAALVPLAQIRGRHAEVLQLCGASEVLLTYRGRHQILYAMMDSGVRSAIAWGDNSARCRLFMTLSRIARQLGHPERAAAYLAEATKAFATIRGSDPRLEAALLEACSAQAGDLTTAIGFMTRALQIDRSAGIRRPRGLHARMLANLMVDAGRADEALLMLQEAAGNTDQPRNLSRVHTGRARAYLALRRPLDAAPEVAAARRLAVSTGASRYEFELADLDAEIALQTGDPEQARAIWAHLAYECAQNGSQDYDKYFGKADALSQRL